MLTQGVVGRPPCVSQTPPASRCEPRPSRFCDTCAIGRRRRAALGIAHLHSLSRRRALPLRLVAPRRSGRAGAPPEPARGHRRNLGGRTCSSLPVAKWILELSAVREGSLCARGCVGVSVPPLRCLYAFRCGPAMADIGRSSARRGSTDGLMTLTVGFPTSIGARGTSARPSPSLDHPCRSAPRATLRPGGALRQSRKAWCTRARPASGAASAAVATRRKHLIPTSPSLMSLSFFGHCRWPDLVGIRSELGDFGRNLRQSRTGSAKFRRRRPR